MKMKKIRVLGAKKRGRGLAVHELGKKIFKEKVWGNILYGKYHVLM